MRLMVASDIHGSAYYCRKMFEIFDQSDAGRLLLLGDLLYHGPRNDLPLQYAPKEVIPMLNAYREKIWCVQGNCDAQVDQMVLDFPIMASYCILPVGEHGEYTVYATHGHIFHEGNLPPMIAGDILLHGHTHIPEAKEVNGIRILNPGSVAIPKGGFPPSYAIMTEKSFTVLDFDGNMLIEQSFGG